MDNGTGDYADEDDEVVIDNELDELDGSDTFDDADEVTEDDDEEDEPKLQYERLGNDLPKLLQQDAATCIAIHMKYVLLGTHYGKVHMLDTQGVRMQSLDLFNERVTGISVDETGEYIAACSVGGSVVLRSIFEQKSDVLKFPREVNAVELDPNYALPKLGHKFLVATDRVQLFEQGLFGNRKSTVLHQGEGKIRSCSWKGRFAAWASDLSVLVFDMQELVVVTMIKRDHGALLRPELYVCHLHWIDCRNLLIGWADRVKRCLIGDQNISNNNNGTSGVGQTHRAYFVSQLTMRDFYVCGIAPFGNYLIILATDKQSPESGDTLCSKPQIHLIEDLHNDYTEVSNDILSITGHTNYLRSDYAFGCLPQDNLFLVVSPHEVIKARPSDDDDHVDFLLKLNRFDEALKFVVSNSNTVLRHSLLEVGQLYLQHLLQCEEYDKMGYVCSQAFANHPEHWEPQVLLLARKQQLRCIARYLPTRWPPILPKFIYELVLNEYIQMDQEKFLLLLGLWDRECPSQEKLYHVPSIINAVRDKLSYDPYNQYLKQGLAQLYTYSERYNDAISTYIDIGATVKVFELVEKHSLFSVVSERLERLMELNPKDSSEFLVKHRKLISIESVADKLVHKPELLYEYLDQVASKDLVLLDAPYHGQLVEMYAKYDPKKLLPFLHRSNKFSLESALAVCQKMGFVNEEVFLLSRMGSSRQALELIVNKMKNVEAAIQFCHEANERDLWDQLIEFSLDKPEFIRRLLHQIGIYVDPICLITKIPNGLVIPNLRDSLVKMMHDYNSQITLHEGCKRILIADCCDLMSRLNRLQRRGLSVSEGDTCSICKFRLASKDPRKSDNITVFNCRHMFHKACLDKEGECSVCRLSTGSSRQRPHRRSFTFIN